MVIEYRHACGWGADFAEQARLLDYGNDLSRSSHRLAVEFFVLDGELLVNELAARPHNSGHLTIEASATSQFENHLRAVAGLPLGSTDRIVPAAAMANIVGQTRGEPQDQSFSPDVFIHMYGKTPRPGRKLGHVTAIADTTDQAIERALDTAKELEQESEMS